MMTEATGQPAVLWGTSIVGFDSYRGPTGDWPLIGFSPRKADLVLYLMPGFAERADLLARLGKHRTGASCVYLSRLESVDMAVLRELIERSVAWMRAKHGL